MNKTGVFALLIISSLQTAGWATDPFDNWANPNGGYAVAYPLYYGAQRITDNDGNTAVPNLRLHLYETILRYVYYFNKDPKRSGLINVLLPVGHQEILGRHDDGLGDPTLTTGVWLVNDPQRHFYFALGGDVDLPIGHYDKNNPASLGQNVWKFRPLLNFAKFAPPVDVEGTVKYNISTENVDTGLKQGNQWQLGWYTGVFLGPQWLVGGHLNYFTGDDVKLNGTKIPNSGLRKFQSGPNVHWQPTARFFAMLEVLRDFATRNTTEGTLFEGRLVYKL